MTVCEYPHQKITEIHKLSSEQKFKIGDILISLWNADLRNSFSHSQYSISGDIVLYTKDLSPISRTRISTEGMPYGKGEIKYLDLEKYYTGSCKLIDVFEREYKQVYEKVTQKNRIESDSQ